ncbi:unnamed protein product [Chondrus crispus]|uniref:Uncharacterized protein n=1 Tax=Chondrus crispus TaxID=2769 RepID=R7QAZ1_CHOCR|nr:unnamed protein product [Chondrus crispus]CDF34571.1 unnamed protein product [Chondrus crispus]|eukprot:XP_005714390.1 unnamed protein product [Chondrus crispus]
MGSILFYPKIDSSQTCLLHIPFTRDAQVFSKLEACLFWESFHDIPLRFGSRHRRGRSRLSFSCCIQGKAVKWCIRSVRDRKISPCSL